MEYIKRIEEAIKVAKSIGSRCFIILKTDITMDQLEVLKTNYKHTEEVDRITIYF